MDHPLVLSFIFHPRKDSARPPDGPRVREYLFPVDEGVVIGSRFYISGSEAPVILYFHGNGEIATDHDEISGLYTDRGMNLLVLDYRGYGKSTGTPSLAAMIRDAGILHKRCTERLLSAGFTGDLWVMGRSLGSASALEVARCAGPSLKGLILESGFADTMGLLERVGVPVHKISIPGEWTHFNVEAIREVAIPTLIIHGEWDQIIPVTEGKALFQASGAERKELLIVPEAGHNDLLWVGMEQYMEAISRFVMTAG